MCAVKRLTLIRIFRGNCQLGIHLRVKQASLRMVHGFHCTQIRCVAFLQHKQAKPSRRRALKQEHNRRIRKRGPIRNNLPKPAKTESNKTFCALADKLSSTNIKVAGPEGFEPPFSGSEGRRLNPDWATGPKQEYEKLIKSVPC